MWRTNEPFDTGSQGYFNERQIDFASILIVDYRSVCSEAVVVLGQLAGLIRIGAFSGDVDADGFSLGGIDFSDNYPEVLNAIASFRH